MIWRRLRADWSSRLQWAYERTHDPFERSLLDEAVSFMATAKPRQKDDVVLHQDLHGGNVLRRGAEWVAIDPKPLVAERPSISPPMSAIVAT